MSETTKDAQRAAYIELLMKLAPANIERIDEICDRIEQMIAERVAAHPAESVPEAVALDREAVIAAIAGPNADWLTRHLAERYADRVMPLARPEAVVKAEALRTARERLLDFNEGYYADAATWLAEWADEMEGKS